MTDRRRLATQAAIVAVIVVTYVLVATRGRVFHWLDGLV